MKLKEILDHDYRRIMYRTNLGEIDMLCGYCTYEDGELKSLDEDTYSLDDEITKYEYDEDMDELIVWVTTELTQNRQKSRRKQTLKS